VRTHPSTQPRSPPQHLCSCRRMSSWSKRRAECLSKRGSSSTFLVHLASGWRWRQPVAVRARARRTCGAEGGARLLPRACVDAMMRLDAPAPGGTLPSRACSRASERARLPLLAGPLPLLQILPLGLANSGKCSRCIGRVPPRRISTEECLPLITVAALAQGCLALTFPSVTVRRVDTSCKRSSRLGNLVDCTLTASCTSSAIACLSCRPPATNHDENVGIELGEVARCPTRSCQWLQRLLPTAEASPA